MKVLASCMGWVPICWRELLELLSMNTKPVEDTLLGLAVSDKPISDPMTVDCLDNLATVNDPLSNMSEVVESLVNPIISDKPFHTLVIADKPLGKLHTKLPDLPNSIVEDILCRLSAKCIFQCQRDSKALQVLTKTRYFTQMQLNRASPVIILQSIPKSVCDGYMELSFINEVSHNVQTKIVDIDSWYMQKHNPIQLLGSHDGFLLFTNRYKDPPVFYLWNPITNQKATFRTTYSHFHVCGFYFCSQRMEYVLLFVSRDGPPFEFRMYNLGTNSWKKVGNYLYPPSCDRPAVIVNKMLYWMVDQSTFRIATGDYPSHSHSILSFELENKKFGTMGLDILFGMSVLDRCYLQVHLLVLEEELCICDFTKLTKLEVSVLNEETKSWVKRHSIILPKVDLSFLKRPLGSFGRWANNSAMEVLHYKKGELLVRDKERLFIYNLDSSTWRLVESKGLENCYFQSVVHIDSLVWF